MEQAAVGGQAGEDWMTSWKLPSGTAQKCG